MAFKMYVDADGLPFSDYGIYHGIDIGRQRSILAVAERGLWYWNTYLRDDAPDVLLSYDWERKWPANFDEFRPADQAVARTMFFNCARWLLDNIKPQGDFSVWVYPYPFSYDTQPGWRSAHTQAVGLQLLARAADMTGDPAWLAPADKLLAAFSVDIKEGGLSTRTDDGKIWFEKMADSNNLQPKVLNGLLFTILGLKDIAHRLPAAEYLAAQGIETAVEYLPRFDLGDWSAYDIHGRRASDHYHHVHLAQLSRLAETLQIPAFRLYHDKFQSYLKPQA